MCYSSKPFKAGSVTSAFDVWKEINTPDTILSWVRDGVKIPLVSQPQPFCLPNHKLSQRDVTFIDNEIQGLLKANAIEVCAQQPTCVSPIGTAPKKGGKLRLITDLRQLNNFCTKAVFQYEDIRSVSQLIKPKDYLVTLDIKNGFFHVPVHNDYRDYLGFRWRNRYFRWKVLPFGLSLSPYFFGKCLKPIVTFLRAQGLRICCYVDDFLLMSTESQVFHHRDIVIDILQKLGICINFEKSSLIPEQCKTYLGFKLHTDSDIPTISIPGDRIRKLKKDILRVLDKPSISARILARVAGQCVSMFRAVAPGKLMLRNVYRLLGSKKSWEDILVLDEHSYSDLRWWLSAVQEWNGHPIQIQVPEAQIFTDASHTGYGASYNNQHAAGFWTQKESNLPSNSREMLAILMALHTFGKQLQNKSVQIVTDNISAMCYINHLGGPSPQLTQITKAIWLAARDFKITLTARFLAGCRNVVADGLSRLSDKYEWQLNPRIFSYLDSLWGPHTVDRFATLTNTLVPVYNSLYLDPKTSGIDALAQLDWASENNYVNPPFRLLSQVLRKIELTGAIATVIAPKWVGQPWFALLQSMLIAPPIRIPKSPWTILSQTHHAEPMKNMRWRLYAWRVCGRRNWLN